MKSFPLFLFFLSILLSFFFSNQIQAQDKEKINLANEYYSQGEMEKAELLFKELLKNQKNINFIHNTYLLLLIDGTKFKEAQRYLTKIKKWYPDNVNYDVDYVFFLNRLGKEDESEKYLQTLLDKVKNNQYKLQLTAQQLARRQLMEQAIYAYHQARKIENNPQAYSLQLANLHRLQNNKEDMLMEYLHFVEENPSRLNYVKNLLQNFLTEEEDLEAFEQMILAKIRKEPDNKIYGELLLWINIQQKDFYGAFVQARALDKRLKTNGNMVLDIAAVALKNNEYGLSIEFYEYLLKTYPASPTYFLARKMLITAKEEKIKNSFPVDKDAIRNLIAEYQLLIDESENNNAIFGIMRSKALLHAFYLDEKDSAINILQGVTHKEGVDKRLKSLCKLNLGDIYLLIGEPWESTLLYSQVEKEEKNNPLAYESKLKNAKLSYYEGNFDLAQAHLDILKQATSREISNNAIALSLLIKDNTVLDSTATAMKDYAAIDLLLFQNQNEEAMDKLDKMLITYPRHSLTDEIWWLQAKLLLKTGQYLQVVDKLSGIVDNYQGDILADDAAYLRAKIYEENLKDEEMAMQLYTQFMSTFRGSIFIPDVRRRFRKLRGDFIN